MAAHDLMEQARRALDEGRREDAQAILVNVVVRDAENENAWLLLAEALTDPAKKFECLERARRINPHNPAIQQAIRELQADLTHRTFDPATPACTSAPERKGGGGETDRTLALLASAEALVPALLMATEPGDIRSAGVELVRILHRAYRNEPIRTRRWASTAGRAALVKYERALSSQIASLPQDDPRLPELREQRQRALGLFK